jgi:hypothetical protein
MGTNEVPDVTLFEKDGRKLSGRRTEGKGCVVRVTVRFCPCPWAPIPATALYFFSCVNCEASGVGIPLRLKKEGFVSPNIK